MVLKRAFIPEPQQYTTREEEVADSIATAHKEFGNQRESKV